MPLTDRVVGVSRVGADPRPVGVDDGPGLPVVAAPLGQQGAIVTGGTKQISLLSGFCAVGSSRSAAISRTCGLVSSPSGNAVWASCA